MFISLGNPFQMKNHLSIVHPREYHRLKCELCESKNYYYLFLIIIGYDSVISFQTGMNR